MRLIDADKLVTELAKDYAYVIADFVNKQPTVDAVAVVRCKNCKHYDRKNGRHCAEFNTDMGGHDFCSCGITRNKESDTNA